MGTVGTILSNPALHYTTRHYTLSVPRPLPPASVVQGGVGSGILYNIMTCDLPDTIHTDHPVSLNDYTHHCAEDGDMVSHH